MAIALEELQAQVRNVARPEEDPDTLIEVAVREFVARRSRESEHGDAARAEAEAVLRGPRRFMIRKQPTSGTDWRMDGRRT